MILKILRKTSRVYNILTWKAFRIHSILPTVWDGAGGNYFGKDWSALGTLLDKLKVEEPQSVIYFLQLIDAFTTRKTNKDIDQDRKRRDKTSKAPVGQKKGIEIHG